MTVIETSAWIALSTAALAIVCAIAALMRARRAIRSGRRVVARVIALAPAEFGAQNFSPILERNGLRKHVVQVEGDEEPITIASYWWREAGTTSPVVITPGATQYRFVSDLFTATVAFAVVALVAAVIAALFWFGSA